MAAITQQQEGDSLDKLEDRIEYLLKFVTIISELVLLIGLGYAGFKLAHKGPTPDVLDQIWLVSQVLALDLSAPGLFAMAKQARDNNDPERAKWAIRIAGILITMSILTMAEGAVTSYIPNVPEDITRYITLAMMIIRGGAAVGYSVFRRLQKAERPTQPLQDARIDRIEETINALTNRLTTIVEGVQNQQPTQSPTQATQVVEITTHASLQPARLRIGRSHPSLHLLSQVATHTAHDEDEPADEADSEPIEQPIQVLYPVVAGVSAEKVKQLVDAFLNGVKWREMPGNYSQTIKPVRDAYELLNSSIQEPTQATQ